MIIQSFLKIFGPAPQSGAELRTGTLPNIFIFVN